MTLTVPTEIKKNCQRFLSHRPRPSPKAFFTELAERTPEDFEADFYGSGQLVRDFELEMADLLGQEDAIFMPSGTMAQQIMLKIWSERKQCHRIAFHRTSHLEVHEQKAYAFLHGLESVYLGTPLELFTPDDLSKISQPISSLLVELPQRELGGILHPWDHLVKFREWTAKNNAAMHLDGARLWESAPYYSPRTHKEIASLFDSIYVSFYKGLGGLGGAIVASTKTAIAEARIWQRRHGGNLISLYPYVISAKLGMDDHLSKMGAYHKKAISLAKGLNKITNITTAPESPHTNMMKIHMKASRELLIDRATEISKDTGIWLFGAVEASEIPGWYRIEVSVSDATLEISDQEIIAVFNRLIK